MPALVHFLGGTHTLDGAAQVTRRFSSLGVASVSVLIASGLTNAWYLVGDVPALFGTDYGRLLLAKLGLFAAMLGLAVANRGYLAPRLAGGDRRAGRLLRRNAILEIAAGIGVVIIVGALGVTVPAMHQSPVWPFDHTLSWQRIQHSAWVQLVLAAAGMVACIAAAIVVRGALSRPPRMRIAALAGVVVPAGLFAWLLAVPAYPTTYAASPVRYTTDSIIRGASLYSEKCSSCHGVHGRGDGPAASSLSVKPANLVEHSQHHRVGDLFWQIAHGISGTPMPGFTPHLSDAEIWALVQFLRAQAESEEAMTMTASAEPWRPIAAPDFTFEVAAHAQESLKQQANHLTLLVLYTLPQSLPRLRTLAMQQRAFTEEGVRVIAVPLETHSTSADVQAVDGPSSFSATTRPDVAAAYAMFTRLGVDGSDATPAHAEFLIDRQGYLRARWIGVPDAATDPSAAMFAQFELLKHEQPRAPPPEGHVH
jgi:putative copper resistance protein D